MSKQQRFEELKSRGYINLDTELRKEYSKLKRELAKPPEGQDKEEVPKKKDKEEEMVTLTQQELDAMLAKASAKAHTPKASNKIHDEWEEIPEGKGSRKRGQLRLYQVDADSSVGIIVKVDYLKTVFNEESRKRDKIIFKIEVLYEDGDKQTYEIAAEEYIKLNRTEVVEIVDVDRRPMRKVSGKVAVPKRDKEGYPLNTAGGGGYGGVLDSSHEAPLEVVKYDEVFTVRREGGQTFKIHGKYLNT